MTGGGINERDFGALEADVRALKEEVAALRRELVTLTHLLEQARGGWKVLGWIIGAAFAAGGLAVGIARAWR